MSLYQFNEMTSFIDYFLKVKEQEDAIEQMFSENRIRIYENNNSIYDEFSQSKDTQQFKASCNSIEFFTTSDGQQEQEKQNEPEEPVSEAGETTIEVQTLIPVIPRQENQIDVNTRIVAERNRIKKGTRFQTHNLGYYFYRITLQKLKDKESQGVFNEKQLQTIREFEQNKGNFSSFHDLFESKRIKKQCLQFYSSPDVIKTILQNQKLPFQKKLIMIKCMEKMRIQINSKQKSWKK